MSDTKQGDKQVLTRALKRWLPLWTFRAMPYRWCRWIWRAELERGQRYLDERGW